MLADVINLLNPHSVIFAGPLFRHGGDFLLDQVKDVIRRRALESRPRKPDSKSPAWAAILQPLWMRNRRQIGETPIFIVRRWKSGPARNRRWQ